MVGSYLWSRLAAQLRSAVPVVLYLLAVQVLLLGVPVRNGLGVAAGIGMVVVGLAAFLEGLMLAIMPVGELCGLNLPRRVPLPGILAVVFLIGLLATAAEPSIVVLQRIGESVMPWDAPLLFVLLGRRSLLLVLAIGVGVGIAFTLGMLRALRQWPLKPVLLVSVCVTVAATIAAGREPNLARLCGLAWDAGGITTSDVTVPLMLALGVGLARMAGRDEDEASGFGSVAMASLVPILTVLALGALLLPTVPRPMSRAEFLAGDQTVFVRQLFGDRQAFDGWAAEHLSPHELAALSEGEEAAPFGDAAGRSAPIEDAAEPAVPAAPAERSERSAPSVGALFLETAVLAARAVVPLALFLVLIVRVVLRRRLPWPDETLLGVLLCLAGMTLFTAGLELGLLRMGEQSGESLPTLFQGAERIEDAVTIRGFDPSVVFESVAADGSRERFFLLAGPDGPTPVPFVADRWDAATGTYLHVPRSGPRIPGAGGWIALLLVGLGLGFTTTLMEPSVAALGITMENITVGVFTRGRFVAIVSGGVGLGTLAGFAMLTSGVPLIWILVPLYAAILGLTMASSELFAGMAWDAGGATTASITVPLVLSIGAGLGGRVGAAEHFGILALASGFPIITVLLAGLSVNRGRHQGEERRR